MYMYESINANVDLEPLFPVTEQNREVVLYIGNNGVKNLEQDYLIVVCLDYYCGLQLHLSLSLKLWNPC